MKKTPDKFRQQIAKGVARLVCKPQSMARFREMIRFALAESEERHHDHATFEKRRQAVITKAWERQRKGKLEPENPPREGSTWSFGFIPADDGKREGPVETWNAPKRIGPIGTWMPPELGEARRPKTGVPLPLRWPLSLAECYAVLAAIHDATLNGVDAIDPWTTVGMPQPTYYVILLDRAKELCKEDGLSFGTFINRVKQDLTNEQTKVRKKPGGRPSKKGKHGRPSIGDKAEEDKFYVDWKASDIPLKDFAKARGTKLKEAEKMTARVRTRRNRNQQHKSRRTK